MLSRLHIHNYAIIDALEVSFGQQLDVITGETGAGKSIIIGALSLILGERADTSVLQDRERKCVVEGTFSTEGRKAVTRFLKQNDLDAEDELVLRREITNNGKSRAFINDTPVNLDQLRQLSALLVDLHQQFDTLELAGANFQREVLDALAGNEKTLAAFQEQYKQLQHTHQQLVQLQEQKNQFNKEYDYNKFLYAELEEAALKPNELEEIEQELQRLTHTEGIKSALNKLVFELGESETPVVQQLKQCINTLQAYRELHTALPALLQRLESVQIELQDIGSEAEQLNDRIVYDAERIDTINERMNAGYKLLKKHGVRTTGELLSIQQDLSGKLQSVLDIDDAIAQQEKAAAALQEQCNQLAATLSANRHRQTKPLEAKVNQLLAQVGMPNAQLKIAVQNCTMNAFGTDAIEFLFDANKSNRFEPVRKVASGGELSRLMLCIKSLVAEAIQLPTLIFDEIDTGISGEAARQVGIIMQQLARRRQVICITHQPQIAGKADAHYFVYKEIVNDAVKTSIRQLNHDERITAIAKMLSGEKPTAAALENAREMVGN